MQVLAQGAAGREHTPRELALSEGQQRKAHLSVMFFHKDLIKPQLGQYLWHAVSLLLWLEHWSVSQDSRAAEAPGVGGQHQEFLLGWGLC